MMINIEVAFAGPKVQKILALQIEQGTTAYDAVRAANIVAVFPEIEVETIPMGIFGKAIRKPREEILREGDRVELYRPLVADPKVIRARRAAKMRQAEAEKS